MLVALPQIVIAKITSDNNSGQRAHPHGRQPEKSPLHMTKDTEAEGMFPCDARPRGVNPRIRILS